MTNSIANMEIKRIAKQVTRFVNRYKGANLVDRVQAILEVELEGFANQGVAKSLVYDALTSEVYETFSTTWAMSKKEFMSDLRSLVKEWKKIN